MKNKELFDRTIGILVKAYINETLKHGSCMACAVGNLIAANNNWDLKIEYANDKSKKWNEATAEPWYKVILNSAIEPAYVLKKGEELMMSTGYSVKEIISIEKSFESVSYRCKDRGLDGLMAVCDILMEIHEATNEEITEAKSLFVKA